MHLKVSCVGLSQVVHIVPAQLATASVSVAHLSIDLLHLDRGANRLVFRFSPVSCSPSSTDHITGHHIAF